MPLFLFVLVAAAAFFLGRTSESAPGPPTPPGPPGPPGQGGTVTIPPVVVPGFPGPKPELLQGASYQVIFYVKPTVRGVDTSAEAAIALAASGFLASSPPATLGTQTVFCTVPFSNCRVTIWQANATWTGSTTALATNALDMEGQPGIVTSPRPIVVRSLLASP